RCRRRSPSPRVLGPSPSRPRFFFFSGPAHHRDLHSFPTRRSSDLASWKFAAPLARAVPLPATSRRHGWSTNPPPSPADCALNSRSEEHTSELQSRENLVCRLLLEKKKKSQLKAGRRQRKRTCRYAH